MKSTLDRLRELGEKLLDPEMAVRLFEDAADAIVVVDHATIIRLINKQAELMFGYHRRELYDCPITKLIPEEYRMRHADHTRRYFEAPRLRPMGTGLKLEALHKDETVFPVEINLSPIMVPEGLFIAATVRRR